jgi:hypothetical protein
VDGESNEQQQFLWLSKLQWSYLLLFATLNHKSTAFKKYMTLVRGEARKIHHWVHHMVYRTRWVQTSNLEEINGNYKGIYIISLGSAEPNAYVLAPPICKYAYVREYTMNIQSVVNKHIHF